MCQAWVPAASEPRRNLGVMVICPSPYCTVIMAVWNTVTHKTAIAYVGHGHDKLAMRMLPWKVMNKAAVPISSGLPFSIAVVSIFLRTSTHCIMSEWRRIVRQVIHVVAKVFRDNDGHNTLLRAAALLKLRFAQTTGIIFPNYTYLHGKTAWSFYMRLSLGNEDGIYMPCSRPHQHSKA